MRYSGLSCWFFEQITSFLWMSTSSREKTNKNPKQLGNRKTTQASPIDSRARIWVWRPTISPPLNSSSSPPISNTCSLSFSLTSIKMFSSLSLCLAQPQGPKKHLNCIAAPKHWMLDKLTGVFAPHPSTSPHKLRECLPLIIFLRNRLKF